MTRRSSRHQDVAAVPDVSVVIAAYRCAGTIGAAIRSALGQEGASIEVIVCDDASGDGSAEVAASYGDPRLRVLRRAVNGGPGAARNDAIAVARGAWIAVLDADDAFAPGRFARLLAIGADADIVLDNLLIRPEKGGESRTLFAPFSPSPRDLTLREYVLANRIFARGPNFGYLKPMIRREFLVSRHLRYDTSLMIGEDYVLMAECLALGARARLSAEPGYLYTVRSGSTSARISADQIAAILRADKALLRRAPFPRSAAAAQRRRTRSLKTALAYTIAARAAKAGAWGAAARQIAREPLALRHLAMRMAGRLRQRGASKI
ncbi:glycosyltransferase family 2 protein [Rubrimonas sp.]|uniref:glycosyltransferase family 2 protein n=1 Tax=Rubrimonas sp. TaxID=2036015 RepID=UPI002FDEA3DE